MGETIKPHHRLPATAPVVVEEGITKVKALEVIVTAETPPVQPVAPPEPPGWVPWAQHQHH